MYNTMSSGVDPHTSGVFQLVLSIFKGSNLVVKHASGTQLKIVTKVGDAVKTSPNFYLTSTKSDPEFNYQIAWKLSKKELQDLRLSRGVVKVELFEVGLHNRTENLIGYCTVSVKDAIEIASYDEIDVKSSVAIPLKGTKSPWKQYGPQLFYILHIEDSDKPIEPVKIRKRVPPSTTRKSQRLIKKSMSPPKSPPPSALDEKQDTDQFKWAINDSMGCFLLGEEGPKDDLYIMSIVTVGVRRFESLTEPTENPAATKWVIVSHCFGVPFEGDEFVLETSQNDTDHLTYLGDRCTARIRASTDEFSRFLRNFVLELKVMSVQSNSSRIILGRSYVPLERLCKPDILEIRENFEVIREDGKADVTCPEIYVIIELKRSPECFKRAVRIEEISVVATTLTQSKEDLVQVCGSREEMTRTVPKNDVSTQNGHQDLVDEPLLKNFSENLTLGPRSTAGDEKVERVTERVSSPCNEVVQNEAVRTYPAHPPVQAQKESDYAESVLSSSSSATKTMSARSVPLSSIKFDPGEYKISFFFNSLRIKCKQPKDGWKLTFFHSPLGVDADDECELSLRIKEYQLEVDSASVLFEIEDNEVWKVKIPILTQEILQLPLEIRIHPPGSQAKPDAILSTVLPIGEVFRQKLVNNIAQIKQNLKVLYTSKHKGKAIRVGYMMCTVVLEKLESKPETSFSLQQQDDSCIFEASAPLKTPAPPARKSNKGKREPNHDVDEYKLKAQSALQNELKAKGEAYLKMLSQEYKKQKEESEREINRKLSELETLKLSYNSKLHDLRVQEERLRKREQDVEKTSHKATMEVRSALQEIQMKYKKLEMDKKLQVEALQRRIETTAKELNLANSKISTLEKKLEAKNEEISSMHAQRLNWPEIETIRRLEGLEHENVQLKQSLEVVTQDRDRYKLRCESEIKERQDHLIKENEDLKRQLRSTAMAAGNKFNSTQSARDPVHGIYNEYFGASLNNADWEHQDGQVLQSSRKNCIKNLNSGDNMPSRLDIDHHGEEISRLTNLRDYLLGTCAYTPYCPTIKDIENKILRHITLKEESEVHR